MYLRVCVRTFFTQTITPFTLSFQHFPFLTNNMSRRLALWVQTGFLTFYGGPVYGMQAIIYLTSLFG